MPTTRQLLSAHVAAARRQADALQHGHCPDAPRRRVHRGLPAGACLAAVAVAVLVGLRLLHGDRATGVPSDGVVQDRTGGVYVAVHGVLHPALNLASARLLAGPEVLQVDPTTLARARHGPAVGIPGAPGALPPVAAGVPDWTVCVTQPAPGASTRVSVAIGATPPRAGTSQLVAVTPLGTRWLLTDGRRYRVDARAATLLGLAQVQPVVAPQAVLDLLPAGADVTLPPLPGRGGPARVGLPVTSRVGDLLRTTDTGVDYLVLDDGLAAVSPFAAALLAGSAPTVHHLPARAVANARLSTQPTGTPAGWPRAALQRLRTAPAGGAPLCVTGATPRWRLPARAPEPTGHAVVVRTRTGYDLVLAGVRYPVADGDALARLGYRDADATQVPAAVLALLPRGPALDPRSAARVYGTR